MFHRYYYLIKIWSLYEDIFEVHILLTVYNFDSLWDNVIVFVLQGLKGVISARETDTRAPNIQPFWIQLLVWSRLELCYANKSVLQIVGYDTPSRLVDTTGPLPIFTETLLRICVLIYYQDMVKYRFMQFEILKSLKSAKFFKKHFSCFHTYWKVTYASNVSIFKNIVSKT